MAVLDALPVVSVAARIVAAGRQGALAVLADEVDALLADRATDRTIGALTTQCPRAPVKVHGPRAATGAELATLAAGVGAAAAVRRGRLGGVDRDVLVVHAPSLSGGLGTTFAIELHGPPPDAAALDVVTGLCAVAGALFEGRAGDGDPANAVESLAAESERARTISELGEAHEAALAAILAALRSRSLSDAGARRAATDAASTALLELRAAGEHDRAVSELPAAAAFDRLAGELRTLCRHADVVLDLVAPDDARLLPGELANAARGITRGIVLALLDAADAATRVRVGWTAGPDALAIIVRDDGPGGLGPAALDTHRTGERIRALGGTLRLDSAAGWGTTVDVTLPLAPLRAPDPSPLRVLHARERDVLDGLVAGKRNRDIAADLSITVHTVKFHVANVLRKLEVSTRGEAAALAREAP